MSKKHNRFRASMSMEQIDQLQEDGSQEVWVLLNDPKKRKRRFALPLFGEL